MALRPNRTKVKVLFRIHSISGALRLHTIRIYSSERILFLYCEYRFLSRLVWMCRFVLLVNDVLRHTIGNVFVSQHVHFNSIECNIEGHIHSMTERVITNELSVIDLDRCPMSISAVTATVASSAHIYSHHTQCSFGKVHMHNAFIL